MTKKNTKSKKKDIKDIKDIKIIKDNKNANKFSNSEKNANIIKWFELLIKQLKFYFDVKTGKEKMTYSYKISAIEKALEVIKKLDFTIKTAEELKNYKNIGSGSRERIDEILKTGKLSEVNDADISGKHLDYVEELMKIFGIGRVKAYELYTEHNIKSIKDLKAAIKEGIIDLPNNIIKGIKYIDIIKTKIPRSEMDDIYSYLIKIGIKFNNDMDVRMCGSYRREKEFCNDIDIIISHPDIITKGQAKKSDMMKNFIIFLENDNFIVDSFTSESTPTKYMGICRLSKKNLIRRIDIRFIPQESYFTALLYFTGSGEFNQRMRAVALSMGYTLNEYRLLDNNDKILPIDSEEDIFTYLNMEYLLPRERI